MHVRHLGCLAALAAFPFAPALAAGGCQLQQLGTLPVDMSGLQPLDSGVAKRFASMGLAP